MKPVNIQKQATVLPDRTAMNQLAKTNRSIMDYSKLSPMNQPAPANMISNLAKRAKSG
jgi:hypothetical protein